MDEKILENNENIDSAEIQALPEADSCNNELLNEILEDCDVTVMSPEFLKFMDRLNDMENDYDAFVVLYTNIENEGINEEILEQCKVELSSRISDIQRIKQDEIIAKADNMTRQEMRDAIGELERYDFDTELLKEEKARLEAKLDEAEQKVLANFCSGLESINVNDIVNFKEMLETDGFKAENVSVYADRINRRYWSIIYKDSCAKCKQTVISDALTDDATVDTLIYNFEQCGRLLYKSAVYINRISNVYDIRKAYYGTRLPILERIYNESVDYITDIINKSQLNTSFSDVESFIFGNEAVGECTQYDNFKSLYEAEETPLLYMLCIKPKAAPDCVLSITDRALYLVDNEDDDPVIRFPLEEIEDIKASVSANEIYITSGEIAGVIYTQLPYRLRVILTDTVHNIVDYLIGVKEKNLTLLDSLKYDYDKKLAACFKKYPIPNDDKLIVEKPVSLIKMEVELESSETWVCKCGKVNKGNFCSSCGSNREDGIVEWTCACGAVNKANFCTACGRSRIQDEEQ